MGVTHEFEEWKGKIKNNDNYLSNLHEELGVTHDYATWKNKVIGPSTPKVPAEYKPEKADYSKWEIIEEIDGVAMSQFKDPEGNLIKDEDVPEELRLQWEAFQKKPGEATSFKEFLVDTKGTNIEDQNVIGSIDSHKLIGQKLEAKKQENISKLEEYNVFDKKLKELESLMLDQKNLLSNNDEEKSATPNFGGMRMINPNAGEGGGNSNQLQPNQTTLSRDRVLSGTSKEQDDMRLENEEKKKAIMDQMDPRISRVMKEIYSGQHGVVDEENTFEDLVTKVMTQEDAEAHFNKSVNEYLENNTGLLDFGRTDAQLEELEKTEDQTSLTIPNKNFDPTLPESFDNPKNFSKVTKALDTNIKATQLSYNNIVKLEKELIDFQKDYDTNVAPVTQKYKEDYQAKTLEYENLAKEKSALGEVTSESDPSLIAQWNVINDKQNIVIGDQKQIQQKQEKLYADNKDMMASYKKADEDIRMWSKDYKNRLAMSSELVGNAEDLVAYQNLIKRNSHNVVAGAAWLTTSTISLASGLEGAINAVKELPEDLLFEYYDNDYSKMPAIVKQLKGYDVFTDAMRLSGKEKVNNFISDLNSSVSEVKEFDDIDGVDDLGLFALHGLANFAPQIALMAATGGASIYVMGASAFGNKYDEMEMSNAKGGTDYTLGQKWLASTIVGGSEVLSEKVTFNLFKGMGGQITKRIKDKGFAAVVNNFSIKGTLATVPTMGMESGSEGLAQIGGNIADKFVLGKDISLFEGVEGAMFTGLIMERSMSMPGVYRKLAPAFMGKNYQEQMASLNTQQKEFGDKIMDQNLPKSTRDKFEEKWLKIQEKKETIMAENVENINMMSTKEKDQLINIENELHKIKKEEDEINSNPEISKKDKEALIQESRKEETDLLTKKYKLLNKYESPETAAKNKEKYKKQVKEINKKLAKINKNRKESDKVELVEVEDTRSMEELVLADQAMHRENIRLGMEVVNDPSSTPQQVKTARDCDKQRDGTNERW